MAQAGNHQLPKCLKLGRLEVCDGRAMIPVVCLGLAFFLLAEAPAKTPQAWKTYLRPQLRSEGRAVLSW